MKPYSTSFKATKENLLHLVEAANNTDGGNGEFVEVCDCKVCTTYCPTGICAPIQPIGSCTECEYP